MSDECGYLVVLRSPGDAQRKIDTRNKSYMGIGRLPAWPTGIPQEDNAWKDFVLHLRGDGAFLPKLNEAKSLLQRLSGSPRSFDIIYCEVVNSGMQPITCSHSLLGYDVVGIDEYWSYVSRFPVAGESLEGFYSRLNKYGLFDELQDARKYMNIYRQGRHMNYDSRMDVYAIFHVEK